MPYRNKPLTNEELQEIREHNKRKLDEILAIPDYQLYLGKKYYGDRYHTILEDNHYIKKQHRKDTQKYGSTFVPYLHRPVLQYDLEDNFIRKWDSALEWAESEGKNKSAATHVSKCATGRVMSQKDSAYGYKWKFDYDSE